VFVDPGYAVPGVEVVLSRKNGEKWKRIDEAETNSRGEFAFELPPTPAVYQLRTAPKGFTPAEKEIMISGEEQLDANLVLAKPAASVPAAKK
jgi:Carboxypeptidase regulatory-like domain